MPKRPRGVRKKSNSNLTEDQFLYLKSGVCLDGYKPNFGHPRISDLFGVPFESIEAMQAAWNDSREYLMGQVAELFARPFAFWRFEAPDRQTFDKWFGFGNQGWTYYDSPDGLIDAKPAEVRESEKAYLLRHSELLTPAERELLTEGR